MSVDFFEILAHDNYKETDGIQLEFFLQKPNAGNTTAFKRIKSHTLQRS